MSEATFTINGVGTTMPKHGDRIEVDGVTLTFGEGTILPGDVYTFEGTEPVSYAVTFDELGRPPNRHERRKVHALRRRR